MTSATPTLAAAELAGRLASALRATLFASNLRINPRRIQSIAAAAADSYLGFAAGSLEPAAVHSYGRSLAADGLGHAGALALVETLLLAAWADEPAASAPPALTYTSSLLAGYMAAREEALLQEQERTRVALDRVRTTGSPGS